MTRLQATFLALSITTALTGCPMYGGGGDDRPEFCVGAGCPCDSITDCSLGLRCDLGSGLCEDATACTDDRDCPSGEVCDTAHDVCIPGTPATPCRTHGDCPVAEYCASGLCAGSSACTADTSCTGGFVCDFRSTCVPPGACRSSADCTGGELCIEGACRSPSGTCQFNYECGAGRACVDNACVNLCTAASQCASGQTCRAGFCETDPSECTASSNCSGAEHCVDGRCLPDCRGATCSGASDTCGVDDFCRPTWEPSPFCTTDAQCALGSVCRGGVCRTPCPTGTSTECMTFDVQLPICQMATGSTEFLCYATSESTPECALQSECGAMESCIDAICRNR